MSAKNRSGTAWSVTSIYLSIYLLTLSRPQQSFVNAVKMLIMTFDPSP